MALEAVPAPPISSNGSPAIAVGTRRAEIAKLTVQRHAIKVAPAPLDDAKAQVRRLVATMAKWGAPHCATTNGQLVVHHWSPNEQTGTPTVAHVVEFLAWFDPRADDRPARCGGRGTARICARAPA
jgi:hypothetical protein